MSYVNLKLNGPFAPKNKYNQHNLHEHHHSWPSTMRKPTTFYPASISTQSKILVCQICDNDAHAPTKSWHKEKRKLKTKAPNDIAQVTSGR